MSVLSPIIERCLRPNSAAQEASRERRWAGRVHSGAAVLFLTIVHASAAWSAAEEISAADREFFERKIRPLLAHRCYECHSQQAKRLEAQLSLDHQAGIRAGGESGPLINTEKPAESLLLQTVGYDGDIQMPPQGKLPAHEIALLEQWVHRGAPMPTDGSTATKKAGIDFAAGKQFWSFQPLRASEPVVAAGRDSAVPRIDAYLEQKRAAMGLAASPPADRRTLIRRATYDLIGLPPTPEEVAQFVADESPQAYEQLLERLLNSPHYGERWGRHWLDLARYADGNKTSLEVRGQAWLYRDWVVRALNADLPYDQFVLQQLAADHLPDHQPADLAALGFWGVSPEYFKELKLSPNLIKAIVADEWEERIDAFGRTFLGLSLACARCHDHKFDPVSTDDYYALAGVLASTRLIDRPVVAEAELAQVRQASGRVKTWQDEIKKLQTAKPAPADAKEQIAALQANIDTVRRETPHYDSAMAHALDDAAQYVLPDGPVRTKLEYQPGRAQDLAVQIRGNPLMPGRVVPRRFLTVLSPDKPKPFTTGSGRLDLARALVTEAAPLTARVIVNRVWALHFGRGLVETVSDFGTQGERPSHPELLDDLARRFIEHGWSLKRLHREMMSSRAYRQSSAFDAGKFAVDPDNRTLWRMNRRRLDVESWRDSLLAACGLLDRRLGGPPGDLGSPTNVRRTLYGRIDRSAPDDLLRLFDFPDPSTHAPSRQPTTTALQQLFVLNSPLVLQPAATLARRLNTNTHEVTVLVNEAYRQILTRSPSANERKLGVAFLRTEGKSAGPSNELVQQYVHALLAGNEFLFVD
jgi:hypothetical protein